MGFLQRLFGGGDDPGQRPARLEPKRQEPRASTDEQAIERYRYLLRTAPPETIEEAHAEAFARLTPEQRRMVLEELRREAPDYEQAPGVGSGEDPRSLARMATRAEMRRPGTLERSFGGMGNRGVGFGGLMAGSFLASFAGLLVGSAIANQFFADEGSDQDPDAGGDDQSEAADDADAGDAGDIGGGDLGGDFGGDFGGGDF